MKRLFKIYYLLPPPYKSLPLSEIAVPPKEEVAYIVADSLEQALEIFKMKRDEIPFKLEYIADHLY